MTAYLNFHSISRGTILQRLVLGPVAGSHHTIREREREEGREERERERESESKRESKKERERRKGARDNLGAYLKKCPKLPNMGPIPPMFHISQLVHSTRAAVPEAREKTLSQRDSERAEGRDRSDERERERMRWSANQREG